MRFVTLVNRFKNLIDAYLNCNHLYIQISSQLCLVYVRALFAVFLDELSDTCNLDGNRFIVVCADDILLISPSVINLENLIHLCERELTWLWQSTTKNLVAYVYWTTM